MEDTNIGLSRRRMLAGLGAVGVASAGAGLGTTAYFSDSESFENNTLMAGQFELHVAQSTHLVDQDGIGPDEGTFDEMVATAHAEDETIEVLDDFLDITDAKPGDVYRYCWDICVKHNPGYVQITLTSEESTGNENDVGHVDASGLLSDYMRAVVTIDDQRDDGVFSDNPQAVTAGQQNVVFEGALGELVDQFSNGELVHAINDGETVEYCHLPCETSVADAEISPDPGGVRICVLLYLPESTDPDPRLDFLFGPIAEEDVPGNAVQGASFEADIAFEAEQCRHNDSPFASNILRLGDDPARNTGFESVSGGGFIGDGYWTDDPNQPNQDGGAYEQLYLTFEEVFGPYYIDELATFTIGDIDAIRYRTRRPQGAVQDYFVEIFTFPDGSNDDASWYGRQIQALPNDALDPNVTDNTWLTWRTDAGQNQLTFYDFNHDYDTTDSNGAPYFGQNTGVTLADLQTTASFDWSQYVPNADSTPKNYRDEEVRALRFATGSGWQATHEGDLDAIEIRLTDGREVLIDLGPY